MITLYKKNALGIGRWSIWNEANVIFISHASTIDGQSIQHQEVVAEGKQSRTLVQQVEHRMHSRINKQLDKGYKYTVEEAQKSNNNTLGLQQPMLAQTFKPEKYDLRGRLFIQPKLNGHRCLITRQGSDIIAYSRQGKVIDTIDHVTQHLYSMPEGMTFDGELFIPGEPLQRIASLVKRKQERTTELTFNIFDVLTEKNLSEFSVRFNWLKKNAPTGDSLKLVETHEVSQNHQNEVNELFSHYVSQGYEGIMLRTAGGKYKPGGRPKDLMKMKPVFDDEVEVVDIEAGANDIAVCVCRWGMCADSFKITAPGTMPEKQQTLLNKDKFIGRRMKIEYRELTNDHKPFHAAATEWFSAI